LTLARKTLRRFLRQDRGAIAVMFALMLPVIVGFIGLGVEVGMWYKERRAIQTAADAGALSAMFEKDGGGTSAEIDTAATTDATRNGYDATTDTITINNPPLSGAYIGDDGYIEVIINRQLSTLLSQIVLNTAPTAYARAVSGISGDDDEACVLALSSSAQNAIYMNGAGSTVNMSGCGVVSNSSNATKSVNVQNGTFEVDCISAAGGINENGTITTSCGSTKENQPTVDDPYAAVSVPAYGGCDEDPPGNQAYSPSNGETLTEGVYCGGISVSSGDTVTMDPGIYVIDEGNFTVNGGGTITGDGVTIILTASDGSGYGTISMNGGAIANLTAPTSADATGSITGDYTGMLFYQDRNAGSSSSLDATFNGGSTVELGGAIYLPENDISFTGGNDTGSDGCLLLVAQTVSFNGNADIENDCDIYGGNPITYGGTPGLVE